VSTFWKLDLPKNLVLFLADTVNAVLGTVKVVFTRDFKYDNYDNTLSFIVSNLKTLGAYHKKMPYDGILEIHEHLKSDIKELKELLKVLSKKNWYTVLIVNTFSLSPIENFIDEDNDT